MSFGLKEAIDFVRFVGAAWFAYDQGKQAYDAYNNGEKLECALHAVASVAGVTQVVTQTAAVLEKRDADLLKKPMDGWMQIHTEQGLAEDGTCFCKHDPEGAEIWGKLYDEVASSETRQESLKGISGKAKQVVELVQQVEVVKNMMG